MSNITVGLSPIAAYEELMHFAKLRGEFALRLAMHAAVPQGIQPELLHLLKRNFVPEAGDDPALEADILFSPLCEEMGLGFFRFDPQVRGLLLENLALSYSGELESRMAKVADFLLAYVDYHDRSTSGPQDQLWRDYLEVQRWVAFAFVDPPSAAEQLAAALENANSSEDFVARVHLGGLASALAAPLAGFPSLLNYAAGLQALELGDRKTAEDLFENLQEEEIKIGTVTLRSASKVLDEWLERHPEYVASPEPEFEELGSIKAKSNLRVEGIGAIYAQDEFNVGQRRINYVLLEVDVKVIHTLKSALDILKAIAALPPIAPHLRDVDFDKMEAVINDAYRMREIVSDITPPGSLSPPY